MNLENRRLMQVFVPFDSVIDMVTTGFETLGMRCVEGIPADAVFVGSHMDIHTNTVVLTFYHDSFPIAYLGDDIHRLHVAIEEISDAEMLRIMSERASEAINS